MDIAGFKNNFVGVLDASGVEAIDAKTYIALIAEIAKDGKLTVEDAPELSELAIELFNTYVVPYDVPAIPEWAEQWAEEAIRVALPGMVSKLLDEIGG